MLEVLLDTHSPGSVRLVGQALYQIHETPSKNDFCLIITPSPLLWNLAKFGLEMSTFSGRYSVSIIWVPRHFPGNRKAANLSWFNEESCCQTPFGQTYRSLRHGKTCAATKRLLSGLLVFWRRGSYYPLYICVCHWSPIARRRLRLFGSTFFVSLTELSSIDINDIDSFIKLSGWFPAKRNRV